MIYVVYKHRDNRGGGNDVGKPCGLIKTDYPLTWLEKKELLEDKYGPDAMFTHTMYESTLDDAKRIADEALQIVADYNGYFLYEPI